MSPFSVPSLSLSLPPFLTLSLSPLPPPPPPPSSHAVSYLPVLLLMLFSIWRPQVSLIEVERISASPVQYLHKPGPLLFCPSPTLSPLYSKHFYTHTPCKLSAHAHTDYHYNSPIKFPGGRPFHAQWQITSQRSTTPGPACACCVLPRGAVGAIPLGCMLPSSHLLHAF